MLLVVLRVQEVSSGVSNVLGIQVNNNYIGLPGELFHQSRSGIYFSLIIIIFHVHVIISICRFILF